MNEPYLAIYVKNNTLFLQKKIPTEREPRDILEINIDEIVSDEFDDASKKLGKTALGIIKLWHPEAFQTWGKNIEQDAEDIYNNFYIAMHLISESVSNKTRIHLQTIDTLLKEQSSKKRLRTNFSKKAGLLFERGSKNSHNSILH